MKQLIQTVFAGTLLSVSVVHASEVTLYSGFHATVGEPIEGSNGTSIYSYVVRGGSTLKLADGKEIDVSIDCLGTDQAVGQDVTGTGNCVWSISDADKIFVALKTSEGGNSYTVVGGTGQYVRASGQLNTSFVYLPSPAGVYLGVERGKGVLNFD